MNQTKTAQVIEATRNATENTFAEDFPETKKLESLLKERLREIEEAELVVLQKAKDLRTAKQHINNTLDSIQGEKK